MKKKIENNLEKITPKLVIIFLYMQPFLDILAAYLIRSNLPNYFTSTIRIIFMLYMIIYLLFTKYENKNKMVTYIILLITTIFIHTVVMYLYKGNISVIFELKTTLSTYYFIFLTLSFLIVYKKNKFDKTHLRNIFIIYLLLTFMPSVLGLSYESYDFSKIGKVGWFYSANVLGSIIIILLPSIITELKNMKLLSKILISIMLLYIIFTIGTKTPVLGLCIIIGINLLYLLYKLIKQKSKKLIIIPIFLIISITSCVFILPKTQFYENINRHMTYIKKNNIEIMSKKFIDHFIFSTRLSHEAKTRKYYNKSHTLEKVFGIGYVESYNFDLKKYKVIEIDYFDVFYKEGIIGFILYYLPVIYIVINIIKNLKLNFKEINKLTSLILIFLIAFFQGHIFVTPAISIFIGLLLVIYYSEINKKIKEGA